MHFVFKAYNSIKLLIVQVCKEIKRNVCVQKFKTEYQPYTESECTTEYKQVIERVEGKP